MLILSEYWTSKTVVNNRSEFNIHKKVESKPNAINIPCLKKISGVGSLDIQSCKNCWELVTLNFELKFLLNFLEIWKKVIKKNQVIWIKGKNTKNHTSWHKNQYPGKKSEREVCLLFWLEICSIIGAYFIPILVPKFQLKITVKTSAKARGLLSLFFLVFLLYSRAILSFSLSPSLLLCPFHCFNCWIILEKLSC